MNAGDRTCCGLGAAVGGRAAAAEVADATGRLTAAQVAWLRANLLAAMGHLGATGEVRVRVVGDVEMDAAHRRYSNVAGTTDVLTFDLREEASGPLDTDLLVCMDEAARAGAARGHDAARELLLYCVHGVLHCLGEDDHEDAASARMHAREDEVLRAIGVGAVYGVADGMSAPPASAPPVSSVQEDARG
ncbi:MAG: rRNA maturation RNase YbeY [Phycisphaerales bacterium]